MTVNDVINELKNYTVMQLTNITMHEKCSYCPYMFEYKCRAEKCVYDEEQERK